MRRLGAVLVATLATALTVELVVAALPASVLPASLRALQTYHARRQNWPVLTTGDAYLGFKLRPHVDLRFPVDAGLIAVQTVSFGLGDIGFRDIGTQPPFEIVAIGDSFTFCDDVAADRCWVRQLADTTGVSVGSLGVTGYSTLAEARLLRRYGPSLRPRLVLVGTFVNDFADNVLFEQWSRSGTADFTSWLRRRRGHPGALRWLEDHSVIYRIALAAVRAHTRPVYRLRRGDLDLVIRLDDWWIDVVAGPERHPGWPLMREGLLDMRRAAAEMDATMAVILMPSKEQVYWPLALGLVPGSERVDVDGPLAMVGRFLAEQHIPVCDLTGPLRADAMRGRQLYHRVSGHWNEAGNSTAVRVITRCLADQGLLLARPPGEIWAEGPRHE